MFFWPLTEHLRAFAGRNSSGVSQWKRCSLRRADPTSLFRVVRSEGQQQLRQQAVVVYLSEESRHFIANYHRTCIEHIHLRRPPL